MDIWVDSTSGYCEECCCEHGCANTCLSHCFLFVSVPRSGPSGSYGIGKVFEQGRNTELWSRKLNLMGPVGQIDSGRVEQGRCRWEKGRGD